ncbi:MAG: 50S ribosomal protein L18 [Verrucomicrobiae bacterium]|nr:50S ribosomal protein L18 [Verrucomicrobiae bacterium]MCP5541559.1 50S ribosomal protein L18 [Akkermansiaceae bacterium]
MSQFNRKKARASVHRRIRKKVTGTPERPRLSVHFSNRNVYAQVIDDVAGRTLAAASTKDPEAGSAGASIDSAVKVGQLVAKRAKAAKVGGVVFDRGGYIFHGKVKALADAARESGLEF